MPRADRICLLTHRDRDRLEWLVDAEARLMAFRLRSLPHDKVSRTLQANGDYYRAYAQQEVCRQFHPAASEWIQEADRGASSSYYRVPFQEAARLVGRRHVLLDRGYCWLPASLLYYVGVNCFVASLRTQLIALHRSLPSKRHEMERLRDVIDLIYAESMLLQQLPQATSSQARSTLVVTPQNVDAIAERHFPLCMKQLHRKFRENHHLKFDGRVQYRVFLKGLGFSVHDSILFFRNEFTKVIPATKFDREYVYHIRHSYGLEGSRKDYAPMDCQKIILGAAPRHGQYHGCPFKHWDSNTLESELRRMGVTPSRAEAIATTASQGRHERACASLFEVLHRRPYRPVGSAEGDAAVASHMHPNQWVLASVQGTHLSQRHEMATQQMQHDTNRLGTDR
jgi:DNA primase large subunit